MAGTSATPFCYRRCRLPLRLLRWKRLPLHFCGRRGRRPSVESICIRCGYVIPGRRSRARNPDGPGNALEGCRSRQRLERPRICLVSVGYSRKAWTRLSGGQQTEGGGFSHRSPPGNRPPNRRCPVLSSTGNTPGDSPSTASGGRVYGLFTGYRRMASAGG